MTTKNKKPSKSFTKKVRALVKTDVFTSIAIASVLLNILFLVTVIVLTNSSTFNRNLYLSARERYCGNIQGVKDRAEELGSEVSAVKEWQIDCNGSDFKPFYQEALDKYEAKLNN